uniref:Uncharacterized protein n=1 Tax=Amphimedon queenslandica TaxID=400682 RepID=A0A1X7USJ9_AMPQE
MDGKTRHPVRVQESSTCPSSRPTAAWYPLEGHNEPYFWFTVSAPVLHSWVDGLSWAMECCGVRNLIHYFDNFFLLFPSEVRPAQAGIEDSSGLCLRLGLPAAPLKVVGPCTTFTFLGTEIDSDQWELQLQVLRETVGNEGTTPVSGGIAELCGTHCQSQKAFHMVTHGGFEDSSRAQPLGTTECGMQSVILLGSPMGSKQCTLMHLDAESAVRSSTSGPVVPGAVNRVMAVNYLCSKRAAPHRCRQAIWGQEWARSRSLICCDNDACLSSGSAKDPLPVGLHEQCQHSYLSCCGIRRQPGRQKLGCRG